MSKFRIIIKPVYEDLPAFKDAVSSPWGKYLEAEVLSMDDGLVRLHSGKDLSKWERTIAEYYILRIVPVDNFCY